jgi:hypothetical protein
MTNIRTDGGTGQHGSHQDIVTGTIDERDVSDSQLHIFDDQDEADIPDEVHGSSTSWSLTRRVNLGTTRVRPKVGRRGTFRVLALVDLPISTRILGTFAKRRDETRQED